MAFIACSIEFGSLVAGNASMERSNYCTLNIMDLWRSGNRVNSYDVGSARKYDVAGSVTKYDFAECVHKETSR